MSEDKKKVPVFTPCEHHVGEHPAGMGWDALDASCVECTKYFPEYSETCKAATLLRVESKGVAKGSVKFEEEVKSEAPTKTVAEKLKAKYASKPEDIEVMEITKLYSKTDEWEIEIPEETITVTTTTVTNKVEGGEEKVATKATQKPKAEKAEKKALVGKKVGHTFKPNSARGEIYTMLTKGLKDETILAKIIDKYGYSQTFAKGKISVVRKLGNL